MDGTKNGDLRVRWFPQIPCKAFVVPVRTVREAWLMIDSLAKYDLFQFESNIKPDYCNAGGLEVFDAEDTTDSEFGSWVDWCDEDGSNIEDLSIEDIDAMESTK